MTETKDEYTKRITLRLKPETYARIEHMKADGLTANPTAFIRDAIDEKLDDVNQDRDTAALLGLYKSLNDDGKTWLIKCATIAASCDETRQKVSRPRTDQE